MIAMPDVQNFFHKALAVIFAEVQHLYFRKKTFRELYWVIPFSSSAFNPSHSPTHLPTHSPSSDLNIVVLLLITRILQVYIFRNDLRPSWAKLGCIHIASVLNSLIGWKEPVQILLTSEWIMVVWSVCCVSGYTCFTHVTVTHRPKHCVNMLYACLSLLPLPTSPSWLSWSTALWKNCPTKTQPSFQLHFWITCSL